MKRMFSSFRLLCVVALMCSCTISDVSGSYKHEKNSNTLQLTKDKKFLLSSGDAGDYSVDNGKILVTAPMFGGASGKIEGKKLDLPRKNGHLG